MDDTARAQEMWAQLTAKNIETLTVWADANQRLVKEWVDAIARTKEIYARAT